MDDSSTLLLTEYIAVMGSFHLNRLYFDWAGRTGQRYAHRKDFIRSALGRFTTKH